MNTSSPTATTDNAAATTKANSGSGDGHTSQIVSFRIATEEYGVNIIHVQEIILIGQITEMPQVPDYVRGLINLRGHVIPIIDLRTRFGLEAVEPTEHSRIIVLNLGDKTIGIIVDAVNEVLRINPDQIEPAPTGVSEIGRRYVTGLVKFDENLLILLNIEQIMTSDATSEGTVEDAPSVEPKSVA